MELTNEIRAIRAIDARGESVLLQFIPETVVLQLPTLHPNLHPWFSMGLLLIISVKQGVHSLGILPPSAYYY